MSPASETIRFTSDAFRAAVLEGREDLSRDILDLWRLPLSVLRPHVQIKAYYVDASGRVGDVLLPGPEELWVDNNGIETTLHSAIYLAHATDVASAIAAPRSNSVNAELHAFARRISEIADRHVDRWAFGRPGVWQVRGWGCPGWGMTLQEFTTARLDRRLAIPGAPFCDSPTDLDALVAITAANILSISANAPEFLELPQNRRAKLLDFLALQAKFFASHFVPTNIRNPAGGHVSGVDFDPGAWSLHGDFAYATVEQPEFPTVKPAPKLGIGWDFAHAWRIGWLLAKLAAARDLPQSDVNWIGLRDAFARQIAFQVLDGDPDLPRFRNFLDGSNGWYRLNYAGRKNTGTPPYGLSRSYLNESWGEYSAFEPYLRRVASGTWRLLTNASEQHCQHLRRYFEEGAYVKDAKPYQQPFTPDRSFELLPFLATALVQ